MLSKSKLLTTLILVVLLVSACQPVVAPSAMVEAQSEQLARTVQVDLDFTQPEWGVTGWLQFDVVELDADQHTATGQARWVEINEAGEVRYVVAEPRCVSFSEDGSAAFMAVEIADRFGWGEGDAGQWMTFWLDDANNEFASPLWPPAETSPGCEYELPPYRIPAMAGDIAIAATIAPEFAFRPPEMLSPDQRMITGQFGFPSPEQWGVDLWVTQDFNVQEVDPVTHEATGTLNWGVYDFAQREWKQIESDVKYVVFDESGQAAMVVSQITAKSGPGDGEPGEYACFWIRDDESGDQFGIHYYSDLHPEVGFKEFFPADELPPLEYMEPGLAIRAETGELTVVQ